MSSHVSASAAFASVQKDPVWTVSALAALNLKREANLLWEDGTKGPVNISHGTVHRTGLSLLWMLLPNSILMWTCLKLESEYSAEVTLSNPTAGFFMVFLNQAKMEKTKC